jgi:hypothetical protein
VLCAVYCGGWIPSFAESVHRDTLQLTVSQSVRPSVLASSPLRDSWPDFRCSHGFCHCGSSLWRGRVCLVIGHSPCLCQGIYTFYLVHTDETVSKRFRTGRLERELQMAELSATRCSCIAVLWVSIMSFAATALNVASQWVFVVICFVTDSIQKLLDTPPYYLGR